MSTLPFPPILMSREMAATYVGVGTTKFDEMVQDGRMPRPRCIDARRVWHRIELDASAADLPSDGAKANPIDAALRGARLKASMAV
jgi:hypothetical protein